MRLEPGHEIGQGFVHKHKTSQVLGMCECGFQDPFGHLRYASSLEKESHHQSMGKPDFSTIYCSIPKPLYNGQYGVILARGQEVIHLLSNGCHFKLVENCKSFLSSGHCKLVDSLDLVELFSLRR